MNHSRTTSPVCKPLLWLVVSAALSASGCASDERAGTANDDADAAELGSLHIPLTTQAQGESFRLVHAVFVIRGPEQLSISTDSLPQGSSVSQNLPLGRYQVSLNSGFQLQRASAGVWLPIDARVATSSPQAFDIAAGQDALVTFHFQTNDSVVSTKPAPAQGNAGNVSVGIAVDIVSSQSTCAPGTHVTPAGSGSSSHGCTACAAGSFSSVANAASCSPWSSCKPGQFASRAGSSTSDRTCSACSAGTFSNGANAALCVPWTACGPGQFVGSAGSSTSDRVCSVCSANSFSSSAEAASCSPWSDCPAGQFISAAGSATQNRLCSPCGPGSFSSAADSTSCHPWVDCPSGQFVLSAGSSTQDRVCVPCPFGTSSIGPNATSCGL